jgi:hypothetical protein
MLDLLLSYGSEAKSSSLSECGYFEYTTNSLVNNDGYDRNKELFAESKYVELISKVNADLFNQPLLLLNAVEMDVELMPASQEFLLLQTNADEYQLEIVSCKLYLKFCELHDSLSFNSQLSKEPVKYSVRKSEIRSLIIVEGRTEYHAHLHSETVPRRITVCMTNVNNFTGGLAYPSCIRFLTAEYLNPEITKKL